MDFKELLDQFALDVGMTEPVAYEEEGLCHLDINDHDYGFSYVTEADRLVIWTAVCPRPPHSGDALLVQLLRANFIGQGMPDGALSLSEDDVIYAHCTLKMPIYDKTEFYELLNRFVENVDNWRTMIDLADRAREHIKKIRPDAPPPQEGEIRFDI